MTDWTLETMTRWLDLDADPEQYDHDELVIELSRTASVLGAATLLADTEAEVEPPTPGLVGRVSAALRRALSGRDAAAVAPKANVETFAPDDVETWRAGLEARYKLLVNELRERPTPEHPAEGEA